MRYLAPLVLFACLCAHAADKPAGWGGLEYLVGNWTGEGSGTPGQGSGAFSFQPDLQGTVLVRKNRAEYPATKERAAFTHDDLMIVYRDAPDAPLHAIYFDSEGHTIRYGVQASADGSAAVFVSAADTPGPRYKLTYTRVDQERLKIKFEIASPGHADEFATYIEAAARRASK